MLGNSNKKVGLHTHQEHQPYRIALVSPSAGVNWSGGAESFAIELSRHLSVYFDVELLCGNDCSPASHKIRSITRTSSYNALRQPWIKPLWHNLTNIPEIWLEHATSFLPCALHLLRRPPALIFPVNEFGGLAMAALVRALTGARVLYTQHDGLNKQGENLKRNLFFRPDRLVVFSEAVSDFVHSTSPEQAVSIIHNGVDLSRFNPEGSRIDLDLPGPTILCVASLRRTGHKRLELTIQAASRLSHGSLLVCGDGPDLAYYKAMGNELLGEERFAIRTYPFAQMPEVYRSADIFTLASKNEPCALSYLEAMASGLPVVTTDDPMRRYTVSDGGIVCDVTDADSYAQALQQVQGQHWNTKARQNAMRFGWDAIAQQYRDVILDVITSREHPAVRS
jgi:glycosyltransferase involved in cell wall biosynthesis